MKEAAKEDEANNKWKTSEAFISSIREESSRNLLLSKMIFYIPKKPFI